MDQVDTCALKSGLGQWDWIHDGKSFKADVVLLEWGMPYIRTAHDGVEGVEGVYEKSE